MLVVRTWMVSGAGDATKWPGGQNPREPPDGVGRHDDPRRGSVTAPGALRQELHGRGQDAAKHLRACRQPGLRRASRREREHGADQEHGLPPTRRPTRPSCLASAELASRSSDLA